MSYIFDYSRKKHLKNEKVHAFSDKVLFTYSNAK